MGTCWNAQILWAPSHVSKPWETLLANILHVDCSLNMGPVLTGLYSTFPSNIVLEYQREAAEKLSEPNFSLGFQLLVLGGLTSWLIWIFHTIPSQLTPKDDHNPLNRPARTMLEVDFQVGLRRDSWPSLPYWSCWFRRSKGDFHMDLWRKLVEMFTQNQISESFRKSIQISPWSCNMFLELQRSPFQNIIVHIILCQIVVLERVLPSRATRSMEKEVDQCLARWCKLTLSSVQNKPLWHSMKSWLINRDPYNGLLRIP